MFDLDHVTVSLTETAAKIGADHENGPRFSIFSSTFI